LHFVFICLNKIRYHKSKAAQKDIDKGNYTPYFDVSKRFFADPTKYNLQGETLTQALPAKAETIAKYKAMYDTPKSREKLSKAYEAGKLDPNAENWYAMGQLEEEYIKRLGEEKGRLRFKDDFADAMAATTGGADPTSNFLMGSYGNFLRERGTAIPKNAYDLPYPIGGRFASGNMAMYDKVSPNNTPERLQKWLNAVERNGGKVEIEPPPNELVPRNPLALIGLVGGLWNAIKATAEIHDKQVTQAARGRDAVISLERNAQGQVVVGKIIFKKNKPAS
jgi:hypothetical protein